MILEYKKRLSFNWKKLILFFLTILFLMSSALPERPDNLVLDEPQILDESTIDYLEGLNHSFEESGVQIGVAIINSLEGQDIESYSNTLFRKWALGDSKKNNGILICLAKEDRKVRIEVGYGLEGAINDALAGRIIREEMVPNLKDNDYNQAIIMSVSRIAETVADEENVDLSNIQRKISKKRKKASKKIANTFAKILFALLILSMLSRRKRGLSSVARFISFGSGFGSGGGLGSGGGFGFGGGSSGGGGASGSW